MSKEELGNIKHFRGMFGKPPPDIQDDQIVMGFDEWTKKFIKVQYRADSNVFFDYPYTGALYPIDRMHKFKPIEENTQP